MPTIRVVNGAPEYYSFAQLRRDHPDVSFPRTPSEDLLESYGVLQVTETAPPATVSGETPRALPPALVDGVWTQQWEIVPSPVPVTVSMRQARLALLGAGMLIAVDTAIAGMPSPQKEAAQIEWEYATEVRRNSPLIAALGPALGLSEEQIDGLFRAAAVL